MKTLRSIGPIAAVIGLVVLNGLASRASELLPVLLVGLGLLSGSAWVWSRTRAFLATAWNADGTVVALQRGRGRTRNGMFPVVQFSTVTGKAPVPPVASAEAAGADPAAVEPEAQPARSSTAAAVAVAAARAG